MAFREFFKDLKKDKTGRLIYVCDTCNHWRPFTISETQYVSRRVYITTACPNRLCACTTEQHGKVCVTVKCEGTTALTIIDESVERWPT